MVQINWLTYQNLNHNSRIQMDNTEPDVKKFFTKIVNSLAIGLLWLFINTTIGIGFNFAFFDTRPTLGNYVFYTWFLLSLVLLILFYKKLWKL